MKVVVRSSDLASGTGAEIVASYDDAADVSPDAHGPGMSVLTVPQNLVVHERHPHDPAMPKPPRLADNWRSVAGSRAVVAEAETRINGAFSQSEQLSTLQEVVELIVQHGADLSKWPSDAKARKSEIDAKWNYVREVRERARAHTPSPPADPTSDKAWPARLRV